jgi:hypothetical protein
MPPAIRRSKRDVRISNFEQPQPISGNPPPDRDMPDAHDLDTLVTRQLLTNRSFGKESLTAHCAHGWKREFFRLTPS